MLQISKQIDKYNRLLGPIFFNNLNVLTYNLFNKFYKLLIKKKPNEKFKEFSENGYINLGNRFPLNHLNKVNEEFAKQNVNKDNENRGRFKITEEVKIDIINFFENDFKDIVSELEEYYNGKIILTDIKAARNFNTTLEKESYSNYFHTDGYVCTLIKVFILLQDIDKSHGPTEFVGIKDQKKFLKNKKYNLNNRLHPNQLDENDLKLVKYSTGKKGDIFICDTTSIIHRAGIPINEKYRDQMSLELCVLPKKKSHINNDIGNGLSQILSKPKGIKKTIKYFFSFI